MRIALAVLAALGTACTEAATGGDDETAATTQADTDVPRIEAPLVDLAAWELASSDPFPDRPADGSCPFGYGPENGLFEISTDLCPYGAFVQPSLAAVRAGDEIELIFVHDALYAEDPQAQAHVGIALGDAIGWETWIPIPVEAGFFRPIFVAPTDAPLGTSVTLHVHNHGVNNYRFVSATVLAAE